MMFRKKSTPQKLGKVKNEKDCQEGEKRSLEIGRDLD